MKKWLAALVCAVVLLMALGHRDGKAGGWFEVKDNVLTVRLSARAGEWSFAISDPQMLEPVSQRVERNMYVASFAAAGAREGNVILAMIRTNRDGIVDWVGQVRVEVDETGICYVSNRSIIMGDPWVNEETLYNPVDYDMFRVTSVSSDEEGVRVTGMFGHVEETEDGGRYIVGFDEEAACSLKVSSWCVTRMPAHMDAPEENVTVENLDEWYKDMCREMETDGFSFCVRFDMKDDELTRLEYVHLP